MDPIVIKTEKILNKGIAARKILAISAALSDDLPKKYLDGNTYCYLARFLIKNEGIIINNFNIDLCREDIIEEATFQNALEEIKKCGLRLHEIMNEIRTLGKTWRGEETFVI